MGGMDITKGQVLKTAGIIAELVATCKIMPNLKVTEIKKTKATDITKASPTSLLALSPRPRAYEQTGYR